MQYTREERRQLELALNRDGELICPACQGRVSAQAVPTPPAVSYVRHRVWLVCLQCKRSASLDKHRPNRPTQ
ncbi:MAG TPA: hypothetical protein VFO52_05010 [Longimicrobiales bacterium]|nr:hypothetical protein [Longimicrobiales bacterium]